ncbi:multidrug effflux MFS transporter [Acidisoma cellulosilytica]|uniref:Bcr/CflA family efflux transporter n=2 Tax=Acidisoma cellulosilyticum TaxID=2802395 RepID=A0A963YWX7_9PROT|nr:multidrug effflux MFS transporter [Acidisoma cellulosilyticum]
MPPAPPLWLLALITFSGTFAMYIFVPALPMAAKDLHAGIATIQMTASLYILGLAVGQLFYGPLSDRFGRRRVLMAGLTLYTLSGLVAALAVSVHILIIARLFQAMGGCSGLVIARAIVRDTSAPKDTARRLAMMNLMVTLGPGMAPIIGSLLTNTFGWRSIFVLLCSLGLLNLVLAKIRLPETGGRSNTDLTTLARNYASLLVSPRFIGYSIGGGCATTSVYAFISVAPFVFVGELHRPSYEVGIYLAVIIGGIWLGSMLASRLINRMPMVPLLIGTNLISVVAVVIFLAAALTGHLSVWLVVASVFVFSVGVGTASPMALTQAISVNPHVIGSASGLYGCTQMAVGALCTALASLGRDPALAAASVLAGAGVVSQVAFWFASRPGSR